MKKENNIRTWNKKWITKRETKKKWVNKRKHDTEEGGKVNDDKIKRKEKIHEKKKIVKQNQTKKWIKNKGN